jgi:hypothetical protein
VAAILLQLQVPTSSVYSGFLELLQSLSQHGPKAEREFSEVPTQVPKLIGVVLEVEVDAKLQYRGISRNINEHVPDTFPTRHSVLSRVCCEYVGQSLASDRLDWDLVAESM